MKTTAFILVAALAAGPLLADPTMREKITTALAESDQHPQPAATPQEPAKPKTDIAATPVVHATVQLPNYDVTTPLIKNKAKIELDLAKAQVAVRQEEAQLKSTQTDKALNSDAYQYQVGPATFAFGSATASARAVNAKHRLQVLDLDQTVLVTSVASSDEDRKDLERLTASLKGPTPY